MTIRVDLWLGDQTTAERHEAFQMRQLLETSGQVFQKLANTPKLDSGDSGDCPINCWESDWGERYELYSVIRGVAVVPVKGSLCTGWVKPYYHDYVMGYENIRDAVTRAVQDPAVGSILLEVNSGGGDANGCEDLATFLLDARKYKPIVTYNGGSMMSAAYWVGSAGLEIIGLKTSLSGSIGVKLMHVDRTEQLKMDGIKVTIIRYGDNKALGGPFEPLTPEVKTKLENLAAGMGRIFEESVALNLSLSVADLRRASNGGDEFLGEDAVSRGLMTSIGNFEVALSRAVARIVPSNNQFSWSPTMKTSATLAGSTPAATLEATPAPAAPATPETPAAPAAPAAPALEGDALALATLRTEAAATAAQLTTVQAELATKTAELATLQAKLASADAHALVAGEKTAADAKLIADLSTIVLSSVKAMKIALGSSEAEMSGADLVAQHGRISATYESKFPIGGVALRGNAGQPQPDTPAPQTAVNVSPLFAICSPD